MCGIFCGIFKNWIWWPRRHNLMISNRVLKWKELISIFISNFWWHTCTSHTGHSNSDFRCLGVLADKQPNPNSKVADGQMELYITNGQNKIKSYLSWLFKVFNAGLTGWLYGWLQTKAGAGAESEAGVGIEVAYCQPGDKSSLAAVIAFPCNNCDCCSFCWRCFMAPSSCPLCSLGDDEEKRGPTT